MGGPQHYVLADNEVVILVPLLILKLQDASNNATYRAQIKTLILQHLILLCPTSRIVYYITGLSIVLPVVFSKSIISIRYSTCSVQLVLCLLEYIILSDFQLNILCLNTVY